MSKHSSSSSSNAATSTPSKSRIPARGRIGQSPALGSASASPAVKARLLELRQQARASSTPTKAVGASSERAPSTGLGDEITDRVDGGLSIDTAVGISRASSRASTSSHATPRPSPLLAQGDSEVSMPSIADCIDRAKRSGRLNIANLSLPEMPSQVYNDLMSRTSIFHPSNQGPSKILSSSSPSLDLKMASTDLHEASADGLKWWELAELTQFKASNNEFTQLEAAIGGFAALQVLDLHNNRIESPIPASFGLLTNLTHLNLAGNRLVEFPLEIMALVHLRELDLSHNALVSLWPKDWSIQLKTRLKNISKKPKRDRLEVADTSFESIDSHSTAPDSSADDEFWTAFPSTSSPVKQPSAAYSRSIVELDLTQPLPSLHLLNLNGNQLKAASFSVEYLTSLPPSLQSFDLADNSLSGSLPLATFGGLKQLKSLNLSNNGLVDDLFESTPNRMASSPFPALETLDISRNAVDSLEHLEECLDSCRRGDRPPLRTVAYGGVTSAPLRRYLSTVEVRASDLPALTVNVADNFLREELVRRRRMKLSVVEARKAESQPPEQEALQQQGKELLALLDRFRQYAVTQLETPTQSARVLKDLTSATEPLNDYLEKKEAAKAVMAPEGIAGQPQSRSPNASGTSGRRQQADYNWGPL